ncbi:MAG: DNA circularization N-terminal domain-containing protein [Salinimicrobium sediminis]|nr:DNA circularization N-terminal domain-containing protein [Salinimicrobium sediminis]
MTEAWFDRFSRNEFKNLPEANASYKGVPFAITSSEVSFGRRLVTHEYPLKNQPYTEDLGRRVRIFTITGFILGPSYLDVRDRLVALSENGETGELIHPYYGNLRVDCRELKCQDSNDETRLMRFQAIYVESGESTFPLQTIDTVGAVQAQTPVALDSLKSPFERVYDVVSLPLNFTSGALQALQSAWDALEKVKTIVNVGPTFLRDLQAARASAEAIVTSGAQVYDSLIHFITFGLFDNENRQENIDDKTSYRSLNQLLTFKVTTDNPSQKSEGIELLVQDATAFTMAQNTSRINFTSATEAREFRNILLAKFDEITLRGVDQDVSQAIDELRSLITQDINARAINLPDLKVIQPIQTQPSVVLSQLLYGTKDNAEDINDRNNIEHPGFIPGGQDLEVLLNA